MKYRLNNEAYHTFEIYEEQKEPPRAYFIPFSDPKKAEEAEALEKRYISDRVTCLNGDWDFRFYHDPKDLPEVFDTEEESFDTIDVPSCIQFRGYDRPFYLNTRYQFPYNPPEIPTTEKVGKTFSWGGADLGIKPRVQEPEDEYNFVMVYRRSFRIDDLTKKYYLSFLGVATNLSLYLNGEYVGYSEGTHNTAEFHINAYLHEGENEMLCVVRRWCTGTYLEAQDMFRHNGIFRDVLLYALEENDFFDIGIRTEKNEETYDLVVDVKMLGDAEIKARLTGHGLSEKQKLDTENRRGTLRFEDLKVKEWNAETPTLYDLVLTTGTSAVHFRVGFKKVEIRGNRFYVNDRLIKFHGVNHHDTSATEGYRMKPGDIEKDVKLCKEFNIDTIRMSHYPPDPLMLELCDEYGIYVVDETDLETHGTFHMNFPPTYNLISDDPVWGDHYVDRVSRLFERDKNHCSIVMYSLGNEAGGYANTDREYEYLKERTDIPVHYESAIHTKRVAYDVGSQMYPPISRVKAVGEGTCRVKELNDRPYFLCEYAHAMGVGPGAIDSYWDLIYAHDNLMGGCVWEMVDHAILEKNGDYYYGGDHGEWIHDGNFCVDGMFYPDRTPSTGAKIVKFCYRPLRVSYLGLNTFLIFNTTGFTPGSAYDMHFAWSDGRSASLTPEAGPLRKQTVTLTPKADDSVALLNGDIRVTVTTREKATGRVVSVEQLTVEKKPLTHEKLHRAGAFPKGFFVKADGRPEIRRSEGLLLGGSDPWTILYRAATDNDVNLAMKCTMEPYYDQQEKLLGIEETEDAVLVRFEIRNRKGVWICSDYYKAAKEGILVCSRLHPVKTRGDLPRFGKAFRLPETFTEVSYEGRTGETYNDMRDQFPVGLVKAKVKEMTEPNIRPQESGNRMDTVTAAFSDGKTEVRFTAIKAPFELSVKPYSDRELISMKHRSDEICTGTYVTLNAFQMGIGSGACGPSTEERYRYPGDRDYELKFLITIRD